MAKPAPRADAKTLALYAKVVATIPGLELKGASLPYTAVNGNMFSMVSTSGEIALRLPSPEREAFLVQYKSRLHEEHGVVRAEYVIVPATLLAKTREIARYFEKSVRHARSLEPKSTTRAKKPAAPARRRKPARG